MADVKFKIRNYLYLLLSKWDDGRREIIDEGREEDRGREMDLHSIGQV